MPPYGTPRPLPPPEEQKAADPSGCSEIAVDVPTGLPQAVSSTEAPRYEVEIRNLSYWIEDSRRPPAATAASPGRAPSGRKRSGGRYILQNICCRASPGEILAVAGPSGAGKSTLLDALGGRIAQGRLKGVVLLNGEAVDARRFRRYVLQDDALFPMLTVRETLLYSARLRLSGSISMTEKRARIEQLIDELGLRSVSGTRIGNEDFRGISGGERRRVSIGVEMIHNPCVLLLDEPTSGLDSTAALNVVELLHDMATTKKRTIILSVHQPSFRILNLFHRVLILAKGNAIHHGSLDELLERFQHAGKAIPAHVNVLEYAIDAVASPQEGNEDVARGSCEQGPELGRTEAPNLRLGLPFQEDQERKQGVLTSSIGPTSHLGTVSFASSPIQEIFTLADRYYKNVFRTRELFFGRAGQVLICGTCLGTLFFNVTNNPRGIQERLGFFAFSLAFLLTSSIEALPIFLGERNILIRETSRGAYRVSSYLFASVLVFLPFLLILAILFAVPSYFLVGLSTQWEAIVFFVLIIWLVLVTANSIVACFSGTDTYDEEVTVFYKNRDREVYAQMNFGHPMYIPSYWLWMHYLSIFKYPFDSLLINEYGSLNTTCFSEMRSGSESGGSSCQQTGHQILVDAGLAHTSKWMDVGILSAYAIIFRVACYAALRYHKSGLQSRLQAAAAAGRADVRSRDHRAAAENAPAWPRPELGRTGVFRGKEK
eukprot:SM000127S26668  [mRNA]  locus=s127:358900:364131:- [translate_table: standard]